ncbi:hypothetical protein LWI28_000593 [Acer negundo]|uniref:Retrotransposon gag domain-containing protein n=1 Tax=Acer negundo TaxID=4023 RepID=A0AAD5JBJ7_ACENE|nr:hypothetical protein LWI28_000593 [Acer negundo]
MGSGVDFIIQGSGSKTNKQRFEALEENQDRIFKSLSELTTSIAYLIRSNNNAIERLEQQLAENKGKETICRQTQGDGRRSRSSWSKAEFSSGEVDEPKPTGNHEGFKRGGRVERGPLTVERWLHNKVSEREMDDGTEEDAKWLDKVEHYFQEYEVARVNRVSTACIYLDGKANSWWRWIKAQYEQDGRQMGWTAFEREFLTQWGPSPVVNHHGQLAKLKQEGRVSVYIEEFR